MLEKIVKKNFDKYSRNARLMPGLIILIPFITYVNINFGEFSLKKIGITSSLFLGLLMLLAKISRNLGKAKQDKLFIELGGEISTIILRFSDDEIEKYTKIRYHKFLNEKLDIHLPLTIEEENINPKNADEKYESSVRWLRKQTRDIKQYEMIFKDSINYGFWRNLWGLKIIALIFYTIIFIYEIISKSITLDSVINGEYKNLSLLILIFTYIVLVFFVNKKMVISAGKAYSRSLLEFCEK